MTTATAPLTSASLHLDGILAPDRNNFGLLRLFAALAVVFSHSTHLSGAPESAEPLVAATGFSLGMHAVHMFFTISGVLIAASLVRSGSLRVYLESRAVRLLPGLIVCILLTALVLGPLVSAKPLLSYLLDGGLWRYLFVTLGLITANAPLPGVFTHNPVPDIVNLPLWTLKYEAMCYAGLALLGMAGLMRSPRLVTLALTPLLLAWVAVAANLLTVSGTMESFLRLAFSFGLGTLAYVWRDRLVLHWYGVAGALFGVALLLGTPLQAPATQVFVAYATLWLAGLPVGWLGALPRKNDLSYGVYIYDWVIAQALLALLPGLSQPALVTATLAILLPVAALSWFLVEKPALGWKRARVQAQATAAAAAAQALVTPDFPAIGPARDRLIRVARQALAGSGLKIPAGL
jgi:peptidoglycan/LPS O-acetylase OafA/YrhL